MRKPFQALKQAVEFTLEEKRSRFIACLTPIESRERAMDWLNTLKQQYPDARHHCWAYVLGDTHQPKNAAFSDDGEPSGTAGKPIHNVITHRQAGNTMAVVVRYFGGIKLGAGGLVRAYGSAVSQALDIAQWHTVVPTHAVSIQADYAHEERLRNHLLKRGIRQIESAYTECVTLHCDVPMGIVAQLTEEVVQLTLGQGFLTLDE